MHLIQLMMGLDESLANRKTGRGIVAEAVLYPPILVGVNTSGLRDSTSGNPQFLERLDAALHEERFPYEANAYLPGIQKGKSSVSNQVWVPVQFYKIT